MKGAGMLSSLPLWLGLDPASPGEDRTVGVEMAAKWIDREAKRADKGAREIERHRIVTEHMDKISGSSGRLAARPTHEATALAAQKGAKAAKQPKPDPTLYPRNPNPLDELRRLADGSPQLWHSSARATLIADGLVEILFGDDGRWAGDRITESGLRALARGTIR